MQSCLAKYRTLEDALLRAEESNKRASSLSVRLSRISGVGPTGGCSGSSSTSLSSKGPGKGKGAGMDTIGEEEAGDFDGDGDRAPPAHEGGSGAGESKGTAIDAQIEVHAFSNADIDGENSDLIGTRGWRSTSLFEIPTYLELDLPSRDPHAQQHQLDIPPFQSGARNGAGSSNTMDSDSTSSTRESNCSSSENRKEHMGISANETATATEVMAEAVEVAPATTNVITPNTSAGRDDDAVWRANLARTIVCAQNPLGSAASDSELKVLPSPLRPSSSQENGQLGTSSVEIGGDGMRRVDSFLGKGIAPHPPARHGHGPHMNGHGRPRTLSQEREEALMPAFLRKDYEYEVRHMLATFQFW